MYDPIGSLSVLFIYKKIFIKMQIFFSVPFDSSLGHNNIDHLKDDVFQVTLLRAKYCLTQTHLSLFCSFSAQG